MAFMALALLDDCPRPRPEPDPAFFGGLPRGFVPVCVVVVGVVTAGDALIPPILGCDCCVGG